MCVRCGTGRVAMCTSPTGHAPSGEDYRPPPRESPHNALRKIERRLVALDIEDEEIKTALDRLWEYVLRD